MHALAHRMFSESIHAHVTPVRVNAAHVTPVSVRACTMHTTQHWRTNLKVHDETIQQSYVSTSKAHYIRIYVMCEWEWECVAQ